MTIIPLKVIFSPDGSAILHYKTNINGVISGKINTVSVASVFTAQAVSAIFTSAVTSAKKSEGIQ